jgi:ABC-type transport system substrate-binding protein
MREEEEEPEKTKVPKKVEDVEPKETPGVSPKQPPPQGKFSIAQEAAKAKNRLIKEFLQRVSIPYDNLISAGGRSYKIGLLPERKLPSDKFTYVELNSSLSGGKEKELPSGAGFSLQPWEEVVIEEVDALLKKKIDGVKREDVVELCVQVLQEIRRFHAAAVEQKKRVGKDWEAVDEKLRKRIVQLRRDQLKFYVDAKDWKKADELSLELSSFSDDPEAQRDIYRLLLLKAFLALNPDKAEDFIALRDAANQFEAIAGGRADELAQSARRKLAEKAQQYVDRAKLLADQNQNVPAFNLLKNAEALDPELGAINQLRARLRDRILYVGVASLPKNLTPATARTDAERWAVDLMFEGLLQAVPDPELGRRFRPALAAALPTMVPMGREFPLLTNARWAGDSGKFVNAHDVYGTLDLLRKMPYHPCAEGLDLLSTEEVRIDDPFKMRLTFRQGMLEPLNRTTFKVLPARYLKTQVKEADDPVFAEKPFGSGPYRFEGRETERADREVAVFKANPYYSQRPGKFGLPNIREVRFIVPNLSTAPADFANGQLHMVLDVPSGDLPRYLQDPISSRVVHEIKPGINRRIWMLAINHRESVLQNADLRRAISAAIDREAILDEYYRPGKVRTLHKALVGPFPPNCWATPEKARKPENALFNKTLAGGLFAASASRGNIKLTLKYPTDDPRNGPACAKIKAMIEDATKKAPGDAPLVEIVPEGIDPDNFYGKLNNGLSYQLAYCSYDYKDDLYWLGSLLDRSAAVQGGRNFLAYLAEGTNPQTDDNDLRIALDEIRTHRNFRDKVRAETWKAHGKFLDRMPFVPLWQIDRHIIAHQGLEMILSDTGEKLSDKLIDATNVFNGVESWRLK